VRPHKFYMLAKLLSMRTCVSTILISAKDAEPSSLIEEKSKPLPRLRPVHPLALHPGGVCGKIGRRSIFAAQAKSSEINYLVVGNHVKNPLVPNPNSPIKSTAYEILPVASAPILSNSTFPR
jgi:hypothetical protein